MKEHERTWIRECQKGNTESFGKLYDVYIGKIYKFVFFRISQKETAEDITSTIFLKALKQIHTFNNKKDASFSGWLFRIARNTIIDYYKKKKEVLLDTEKEKSVKDDKYLDRLHASLRINEVKAALKSLSEDQQEIILMRVWQGLSYKEIASALQKTEASCKMMFSRSIKQIRTMLVTLAMVIFIKTFL